MLHFLALVLTSTLFVETGAARIRDTRASVEEFEAAPRHRKEDACSFWYDQMTCRSGSIESNWRTFPEASTQECKYRCAQEAARTGRPQCCTWAEDFGRYAKSKQMGCFVMQDMGGTRDPRQDDPHVGMTTLCSETGILPELATTTITTTTTTTTTTIVDGKPTQVTPYPVGAQVSYYSRSQDAWINALVEDYEDGYYDLDCIDEAPPSRVRIRTGEAVEYYSTSNGGWMPAIVKGMNFDEDTYVLDIHPGADPIKVRFPNSKAIVDDAVNDALQPNIVIDQVDQAPPAHVVVEEKVAEPVISSLQAEVNAMNFLHIRRGEAGRCTRYKSTTETCRSGSLADNWAILLDSTDRNRCAERCRMLAVRTGREICCTVDGDGCWGLYNKGGVRESKGKDMHIGATLVCGPALEHYDDLSRSVAKWADVEDDSFLSSARVVLKGAKVAPDIFADIGPSDLRQGSLGNCWLIASFASFAVYPMAVRKIFANQFANVQGNYNIQLWHPSKEEWVRLAINDQIPASNWSYDNPKYIKASDAGGFWPLLLEKAFAKMFGGYKELGGKGGYTAVAYAALSGGSPNYMYWWVDSRKSWARSITTGLGENKFDNYVRENMWDLVYDAYQNHKLLSGSCCKKGAIADGNGPQGFAGEAQKANGLYDDHAYSILAVKEIDPRHRVRYCVNEDTGKVVNDAMCRGAGDGSYVERSTQIRSLRGRLRLAQVRNPWGNEKKFTGEWSYADQDTWARHADIKSILDYRDEADGTWWMTFEELERTFRKIYIGSQDMIAFDPPPPECNIGYGASKFDGVRISWSTGIRKSQCGFCEWSGRSDCDGTATDYGRRGETRLCCQLINAKLRGTVRG